MTELSAAKIAFYATAATVMPVLLLAYVVQTRRTANSIVRWILNQSLASQGQHERANANAIGVIAAFFVLGVLLAAFAFPAIAEIAAFHALIVNRAAEGATIVVSVGLIISGAMVLLPAAYSTSGMEALIPASMALQQIIYFREQRDEGTLSQEAFLAKREELANRAGLSLPPPRPFPRDEK